MSVVARRDKFPLRKVDEIIELTSRVSSSVIPDHLKRMERSLGDPGVLDVILATNMISVGVDISRLGLMAVMGQPQSSSEYIQATSRVGRRYPGLVVVLFNSARSRDRSHYESFVAFHNALYRQVDSSSVTPFSARARDRALHAVLVALARLWVPELRPNNQAGNVAALEEHLPRIRDHILDRIQLVSPEEVSASRQQLDAIIENWIRRANEERKLVYQNHRDPDVALLVDANSVDADDDHFGTLWSLRDVDTETKLYLERNRTDA
jgi:superfamily II DNA or RNA helicase